MISNCHTNKQQNTFVTNVTTFSSSSSSLAIFIVRVVIICNFLSPASQYYVYIVHFVITMGRYFHQGFYADPQSLSEPPPLRASPVLGLQIVGGVPVGIEDNNGVGTCQIQAYSSSSETPKLKYEINTYNNVHLCSDTLK